ncbi:MAG: nitroreductase family protein [Anaerolineae bacterium]
MPRLTIDDLFARRSIRKFRDMPVTDDQVNLLLEAAMAAPSAGNRKPWHFVVVRDPETRRRIAASHPYAKMAIEAPVVIVPCGQPELSFADRPAFWTQDVSAATENILLAAVALGLGAVWCGVFPNEERVIEARAILSIPEDIIPLCYIPVGVPAEEKEPRTQYDAARVHLESW